MFVFRNNTVERFFPKDYAFSGYDDISHIPADASGYVWFYQAPMGYSRSMSVDEIHGYQQKFGFVLAQIEASKTLIAFTMEEIYALPFTDVDHSVRLAIEQYNAALFQAEKHHANLKVIDFSDFTRRYPADVLFDWKFYFISQMGLNPKLTNDFQAWWHRKFESIALRRKKCIVLDLDNTLWGGVLGEDGISGIKIGGDYPGKAFAFFQKTLLQLSKAGVILTVCSKNNEADVLEAWDKNPFMVLKKEHFAAYRINWTDKATNIKALADELNLGLDSFVFIDDNPTERELIKQMLPMVSVPDFPAQPYELPLFFRQVVDEHFRVYSITDEDQKKTEQYKANAARAQAQHSFADFGAFLESLDLQITVEAANEFNIPRIAQMTQKTNQFNLTTKRYTDADVKGFLASGWKIWSLSVADRFGDNGITGCMMLNGNQIDTFLLSCRILGKGIEGAFLKKVLSILKEGGQGKVRASYVRSAKNQQVAEFYDRHGFVCIADDGVEKSYEINLVDSHLQIESYYHINVK